MFPSSPPETITLEEVLRNNRFAVLATMHDPTPRKAKKVVQTLYNIKLGKDNIVTDGMLGAHGVDGTSISETYSSAPSFFGQCYNCHYRAHSQKHCPLQQCGRCGKFGHSTNVCSDLRDPNPFMSASQV
jgi:hypothetical protein